MLDSHAHLDFRNFDKDRDEVLKRAEKSGIKLLINVGVDLPSSRKSIELAEKYSFIYAAVGIHPHDAAAVPSDYLQQLEEMARHPRVVALGEMGLDFYRDRSPRSLQQEVFRGQLRLARKVNLPVIIHSRQAHDTLLKILEEEGVPPRGGVMHCFSGDLKLAEKCLKLGLYISFAGPITYSSRNNNLSEVAAAVPLEKLLIETDAPFLPPEPWRGKRNEPAYVLRVAEKIASLKGVTAEEVGLKSLENAGTLFSINILAGRPSTKTDENYIT